MRKKEIKGERAGKREEIRQRRSSLSSGELKEKRGKIKVDKREADLFGIQTSIEVTGGYMDVARRRGGKKEKKKRESHIGIRGGMSIRRAVLYFESPRTQVVSYSTR